MLYSLLKYLSERFDIPGSAMWHYISFRAAMAIILALIIGIVFGRYVINMLARKQIGEDIRNLGLEGQMQKKGTPTMGGLIILGAILIPILLLGDLKNIYVWLMIISTVWLGVLGFLDDYIKVFKKHKEGLKGVFKIIGQVGLGIIVGTVMCMNRNITVVEKDGMQVPAREVRSAEVQQKDPEAASFGSSETVSPDRGRKSAKTTIPFVKNNEFDYHWLAPVKGEAGDIITWLIYILAAIFVITAVSNGANLTDGLDGLATGVSAIIVVTLGALAWLSGNIIYSDYLDIMYIPGSGELTVYAAALVGALIGFLWYNCYPAQVFMGDTGSLAIGGVIAVFALLIRKELLLPLLCGVFLVESISVLMQVGWFKYTRIRTGQGQRLLMMAPVHHHYQKKGIPETRIVVRFWIIQLLLAAMTLATLKIR